MKVSRSTCLLSMLVASALAACGGSGDQSNDGASTPLAPTGGVPSSSASGTMPGAGGDVTGADTSAGTTGTTTTPGTTDDVVDATDTTATTGTDTTPSADDTMPAADTGATDDAPSEDVAMPEDTNGAGLGGTTEDIQDPLDDVGVTDPSDEVDDTTMEADDTADVSDDSQTDATDDATDPAGGEGATGGVTTQEIEPLDCGPDGWAVENHGPPENRVNYVIVADGYDATTINTTLEEHIEAALDRRFNHESGEPYGRYRNFVNICVMKVVSQSNGIGNGPTAFGGGNGGDRLARVDNQAVNAYLDQNLPERLEPSWTAAVLNQDLWENTGAILMLWSGGNRDAAGAALHEGGHGFHQLADEYGSCTGAGCGEDTGGSGTTGREYQEVNSTGNPATTDGKWSLWMGTTQVALKDPNGEATGLQSTFSGSRYESPTSGQYRPSDNSMMNSLFGLDPNTSFNSVSREQMVFSIWQFVRPIDSTVPEAGDVSGAETLQVNVVDPAVINVDWSVDGAVVAENGGTTFDTSTLGSGSHTVSARAYDNATEDLVKLRTGECPSSVTGYYCHGTAWKNNEQTVEWQVTVP